MDFPRLAEDCPMLAGKASPLARWAAEKQEQSPPTPRTHNRLDSAGGPWYSACEPPGI